MVSRGLRLGLGLALLGGAGLGLLDGLTSAAQAPLAFEDLGERLWFVALVALAVLAPLVVLGLCQGALGLLVAQAARRLSHASAPQRTGPWIGRLTALLCAPAVAAVCAQLFRGPQAQRIPGKDLWAVLLGLAALWLLSRLVPWFLSLLGWVRDAGPRRRRYALLCGSGAAAAAVLVYLVDLRVLPRLYPWFHLSLLALLWVLSQVAALFFGLAMSHLRRRWLNGDYLAPAGALLCGVLGAWGLLRLERAAVLRAAALEHTRIAARVLWLNAQLHGRGDEQPGEAAPVVPLSQGGFPAGPRLPDSDLFLITVDALRDDRLAPRTMPFSAGLAARGVRFLRAYTQVPHTSFAVATLLTGKPVYALLQLGQDAADHETLPIILRRARYKTAAFYPPSVFYIEHERLRRLEASAYGFEYIKYEYLGAERRTQQVIDFLEAERPERTLVWVHYLEPHEPYEPHPGGPGPDAPDRDRYDGEVRFVDRQIERLVSYLRARRPSALLFLAADHGEEFGEHGGRYHGTTLYEEQVRVPLVVVDLHEPPRLPQRQVQTPVGLLDVAPTVLGLLDIVPSARMRGRDLGPLLHSEGIAPWPVFGEIGRKKMVVMGDHKLICDLSTDACALYDLRTDPGERRSRLGADPALERRLRSELGRYLTEASRFERGLVTGALDAAAEEALRRGRLGDRGAAPGLARLLAHPTVGAEAARLLTELCLTEGGAPLCMQATPALRQFDDAGAAGRWATVALALGGDAAAQPRLVPIVSDDQADPALRLAAALALTADSGADRVALWVAVLPAAMTLDDPERLRPLLQRLGQSRDVRALPALRAQLGNVRSRVDVVVALGALGAAAATADLVRLLAEDPYVPVRAAAAAALGRLGGRTALEALERARRTEREAPVREAVAQALRAAAAP